MKQKIKQEKAITLIALVITIIVLLILAAVSIAMLTGENGIISNAMKAAEAQKRAEVKEKVELEVLGSYDDNGNFQMETLKENLKNHLGVDSITENSDGSISFTLDGYEVTVKPDGKVEIEGEEKKEEEPPVIQVTSIIVEPSQVTIKLGETRNINVIVEPSNATKELKYTSTEEEIATVNNEGIVTGKSLGTTTINVMDELSGIQGSCTVTVAGQAKELLKTNAEGTQDYEKSPYVKYDGKICRVLYNDEDHGLQIITADIVGKVTLGYGDDSVSASDFTYDGPVTVDDNFKRTAASYNNAVDTLNNKAKTYKDNSGMATDARCLGSLPTLSGGRFQGDSTKETNYTNDFDWFSSFNNKFKPFDNNESQDLDQLEKLGLGKSSAYVWSASRWPFKDSSGSVSMKIGKVYPSGFDQLQTLCVIHPDGHTESLSPSLGLRPVFLLSSNVNVVDGDGSSGDPYELGI